MTRSWFLRGVSRVVCCVFGARSFKVKSVRENFTLLISDRIRAIFLSSQIVSAVFVRVQDIVTTEFVKWYPM
jgi:hypothetical protein